MKLTPKKLTLTALCCGILGLILRTLLFLTGIDRKGLVIREHYTNISTYILIGVTLALIFLMVRRVPKRIADPFRQSRFACLGAMAGSLGILYTTLVELPGLQGMLGLLTGLLGFAAAVALAATGVCRWKGLRPNYWFHTVLCVYLMVHILSQYRGWNQESQLQFYLPQLLASLFLMITAYHRASFDNGTGSFRELLFFNYGALFFSCIAIGTSSLSFALFYFAMAIWTASLSCEVELAPEQEGMTLPKPVLQCIRTLEDSGYTAYVVGGCVRDHLLGLAPHDYDLCTNAKPEEICRLFGQYSLVRSGEKHGTIGVVLDGTVYEITTYRTEGDYSDSRHPDWVEFVDRIEDDLSRRDFTVNAMAYSPTRGYADPFDGQKDLKAGVLRAVGDPETRFREDALRILRGVRFAARFRLTPEDATEQAMLRCIPLMENLAAERIYTELMGFLPYADQQSLTRFAPVLTAVIPELAPCIGFDQHNPHHLYDVYTHTAHAVAASPADATLRLAALLHDIGKPETYTTDEKGIGHFYGHEAKSAQLADHVLLRLKAPTALRKQVTQLIENHMLLLQPEEKFLRRQCAKFGIDTVEDMLRLQRADTVATGTRTEAELGDFDRIAQLLAMLRESESCLQLKDLAIDGNRLLALGVEPGPAIGKLLNQLLEQVVEGTLPNEEAPLLAAAKKAMEGDTL